MCLRSDFFYICTQLNQYQKTLNNLATTTSVYLCTVYSVTSCTNKYIQNEISEPTTELAELSFEICVNYVDTKHTERVKRHMAICRRCLFTLLSALSDLGGGRISTQRDRKGDSEVLLLNGGSCKACALKRCIIFRCITQQRLQLNVFST